MKLRGKHIPKPKPVQVFIPRGSAEDDLVFTVIPISDNKEFDTIVPEPEPVRVLKPGGLEYFDYNDPVYKERTERRMDLRYAFVIIKSLSSDELEWEKVKLDDPSTWELYREELEESGLSQPEINYLIGKIVEANTVDDERVEEARSRFFSNRLKQSGK